MMTVVMVSYLGEYPGSRSGAEAKFLRAVRSFLDQTLKESELIIISDGCTITEQLYESNFKAEDRIRFFIRPKAQGWPGEHRQFGIDSARYDWITYLDSDDILAPERLEKLAAATEGRQLILDSIYTAPSNALIKIRRFQKLGDFEFQHQNWTEYEFAHNLGGTYQLCHRKDTLGVKWLTNRNRGEDSMFIKSLVMAHSRKIGSKKAVGEDFRLQIGGYLICHHPQWGFDV